jgi:hypothetical protein
LISGLLHVTNGDTVAAKLRKSGLPGKVVVWADALHEGPVPALPSDEDLRALRARHAAESGYLPFEDAISQLRQWDRGVESAREHEEAVLWFEHDLFDQLALIRHLGFFARRGRTPAQLSLIAISSFPGIRPFHGLGQLSPGQLASLFPKRESVDSSTIELGGRLWAAFTAPDPTELADHAASELPKLPLMKPALRRLLEEYPWKTDGLGRNERQALSAAAEYATPVDAFAAAQEMEERPFLGDLSFLALLRRLAAGSKPLLTLKGDEGPIVFRRGKLRLTKNGERVLAGSLDATDLRGIDRWVGGVHLRGPESPWRWDARRKRLYRAVPLPEPQEESE